MSELSGFQAREAVDKDLFDEAERLRVSDSMIRVPALLADPETPGGVDALGRVAARQPGRMRDALRAEWGRHVQSGEHMPGGLR